MASSENPEIVKLDPPERLYKFMRFDKDNYWMDTLKKFRLFMSDPLEFNDPFEGGIISFFPSVAGISIVTNLGQLHHIIKSGLSKFKTTCFSETCRSKSMWAYYADSYKGFCLEFAVTDTFKNIRNVNYVQDDIRYTPEYIEDLEYLSRSLKNALLFKSKDWEKEMEWRIIRDVKEYKEVDMKMSESHKEYYSNEKHREPQYLDYRKEDLISIILGPRIDRDLEYYIIGFAKRHGIPIKHAYTIPLRSTIEFYEDGNEPQGDGSMIDRFLIKDM